jgi:FixJ family two-component response regulator
MTIPTDARVFIVDDDPGVLKSVAFLLRTVGIRAQTYASAQEFLDSCDTGVPGCLVLDVRMPAMSGLDLQEKLQEMGSPWPIIFLTAHGDVPMAVKAVKSGAMDFIQKPFRDQELLDKIHRAMEENARARAAAQALHDAVARMESLTPRERQVLDAVVAGKANKVIAADLGVSQRTVEIHRAHVMRKMQADSTAQLVRMAMRARGEGDGK